MTTVSTGARLSVRKLSARIGGFAQRIVGLPKGESQHYAVGNYDNASRRLNQIGRASCRERV